MRAETASLNLTSYGHSHLLYTGITCPVSAARSAQEEP